MQILRDVTVVTAPTAEIITLTEAKNYLRVDYSEDDVLIQDLIDTARIRLEQYAGVAMTPRTLKAVAFVNEFIELPYTPTNSITKVEYLSGTDWIEMVAGNYFVLGDTYKKVYMVGVNNNEFRFTYACGYTTPPESMKTAVLKLVSDLYEYRESSVEATRPSANLTTAYELMKPFKRISIFL